MGPCTCLREEVLWGTLYTCVRMELFEGMLCLFWAGVCWFQHVVFVITNLCLCLMKCVILYPSSFHLIIGGTVQQTVIWCMRHPRYSCTLTYFILFSAYH